MPGPAAVGVGAAGWVGLAEDGTTRIVRLGVGACAGAAFGSSAEAAALVVAPAAGRLAATRRILRAASAAGRAFDCGSPDDFPAGVLPPVEKVTMRSKEEVEEYVKGPLSGGKSIYSLSYPP